ncbi:MAG: peptidoglycan editing factor PgeF [Pseudomonadales bacterium]|nr:peptidoglycan editing factor PgeF [Pseudomonadales bacterium]
MIWLDGFPPGVKALLTTRAGGISQAPWQQLNLATHVGDRETDVAQNRQILTSAAGLPAEPVWLEQVHGDHVLEVGYEAWPEAPEADAAVTCEQGRPLVIMVADCLPVLMTDHQGEMVGAVHAGWRGLSAGILEAAADKFAGREIHAWLGPAIGPCHYEVDAAVRDAFSSDAGFVPGNDREHWWFDLAEAAAARLRAAGVSRILRMPVCTACDNRFYSYRRDGVTGRFAALIWRV